MSDKEQKRPLLPTNGKLSVLSMSDRGKLGGRPTLYTPETVDRLLAALADGLNIKQSCLACGLSESTLSDWRERYPELEPRLIEAREAARRKVLATIKSIGEETNDWRALDTWLQRSFPTDYRRDASINVKATANAQAGPVVISDEKRRELQEKFAKWQEIRADAQEAEIERRVQERLAARGAKELPDKS